jgi:hypothetical protein
MVTGAGQPLSHRVQLIAAASPIPHFRQRTLLEHHALIDKPVINPLR